MAISPLEKMAADIVGTKVKAAAHLTPTPAEARAQEPATLAPFPYDKLDMFEQAIADIERQAAWLREGLGLIRANKPTGLFADPVKEAEKAADVAAAEREAIQKTERDEQTAFEADVAAKAAAAQAATFDASKGWVCPEHGQAKEKQSRLGRTYRACPVCQEFEHLL